MNVTAHQEKEKNEETKKGRRKKRENRRPILKKLRAALLRSFREQHSEKMKGSARGTWDPREGQHPFRPNPNRVGNRTTALRRLLIDAVISSSSVESTSTPGTMKFSWQDTALVCHCLLWAIFESSGPPVFHIKAEASR